MSKTVVTTKRRSRVPKGDFDYTKNDIVVVKRNRAPTNKTLNRKIKRIENRQELKHHDTAIDQEMYSDPDANSMILLNGLTQGDTNITREGDRVTYTSIQFRGRVQAPAINLTSVTWRVIIFRDMQSNGAAPTAAQLLDSSVITTLVYAPYNTDYTDRFRVLMDKRSTMNSNVVLLTAADQTTQVIPHARKINFKWKLGFITNYGLGNAGTIADISKNSVYMLVISDRTGISNQGTNMFGGVRMYYKDD